MVKKKQATRKTDHFFDLDYKASLVVDVLRQAGRPLFTDELLRRANAEHMRRIDAALDRMIRDGEIEMVGDGFRLTPKGRALKAGARG